MVTELTGMDIANASLLDEATAAGEAMQMAYNVHNSKRSKFFVSKHIFPQNLEVMKTRAYGIGLELVIDEPANFDFANAEHYCGVMIQNPDNLGNLHDLSELSAKLKPSKVTLCVIADILSLAEVKPPGEMGVDIAVGSVQRFGVPMCFGGPHPGYLACKDDFKRKIPGRIIGVSKDCFGDSAYRMAL
jgi:glycine dehydrogenase